MAKVFFWWDLAGLSSLFLVLWLLTLNGFVLGSQLSSGVFLTPADSCFGQSLESWIYTSVMDILYKYPIGTTLPFSLHTALDHRLMYQMHIRNCITQKWNDKRWRRRLDEPRRTSGEFIYIYIMPVMPAKSNLSILFHNCA